MSPVFRNASDRMNAELTVPTISPIVSALAGIPCKNALATRLSVVTGKRSLVASYQARRIVVSCEIAMTVKGVAYAKNKGKS